MTFPTPREADALLVQLVAAANSHSVETPVIIHLGNTNIAGTLVSAAAYELGLLAHTARWKVEDAGATTEAVASYEKAANAIIAGETQSPGSERYLHLRDARIRSAGETLTVAWWRGALEDVDSFSIPSTRRTIGAAQPNTLQRAWGN